MKPSKEVLVERERIEKVLMIRFKAIKKHRRTLTKPSSRRVMSLSNAKDLIKFDFYRWKNPDYVPKYDPEKSPQHMWKMEKLGELEG